MNLQRLIAEYRKISRRLRRRALLASARQIQAWKRRLATLEQRIRLMGGRSMRRVALASALLIPGVHAVAAPSSLSGNGNFAMIVDGKRTLPSNVYPSSDDYQVAAFGDLDGDGDLDAFLLAEYGNIRYFKNTGTVKSPNFVPQYYAANPLYGTSDNADYNSINLIDLDHDGDLDLVMTDYTYALSYLSGIRYFKNTGTRLSPTFVEQTGSNNPFDAIHGLMLEAGFGDLDGDGDLDMVVGDGDGSFYCAYYGCYPSVTQNKVRFFRNTGNGFAPAFTEQLAGANPLANVTFATANDAIWASLGDLDGDGDNDVVLGAYDRGFRWLKNTGSATNAVFTDQGYFPGLYSDGFTLSQLVDVDGDGDLDIYSGNEDNSCDIWENVGTALVPRFSQPLLVDYLYGGDQWVDVDGDGDLDLASIGDHTLRNDNGALFDLYTTSTYPFSNAYSSYRAFLDLDADGDLDLASFYGNSPSFVRNDGNWNFTYVGGPSSPFYNVSLSQDTYGVATTGDIDGDGDVDILLYGYYGSVNFLENTGSSAAPVFTANGYGPFGAVSGNSYRKPLLADFDHDHDLDLVLLPVYGGSVEYYVNDGTPTVPNLVAASGATDVFGGVYLPNGDGLIYTVDLDQDGDMDVLTYDDNNSKWYKLVNNLPRFTSVDTLAADKGKVLLGPVPQKAGSDICLFVDKVTDSLDLEVFNIAGERVIAGLNISGGSPCFKADIAPGLYWARVKSGNRTFMQKVIITAK